MTEPRRRAVPRQPADWLALYRTTDEGRARHCRVIDISPFGAGIELLATGPDEPIEGRIDVTVDLRGEIRNVVIAGDRTSARVGIELPELTDAARRYIERLGGFRTRW